MKHIGILAHSAEGAGLCFLTACHEGARRLGEHYHPEVTLSIIGMGESMAAWEQGDLATVRAILMGTAGRLAAAGCDLFVCPDNTAHIALERTGEPAPLPGLHIAEVVAEAAVRIGAKTVGVLGTKWTMEGPVYRGALARRGLEHRIPELDDRAMIQRVIFDELCNGVFTAASRDAFVAVIEKLKTQGCDAVVLGCTEIPLLITPDVSPLPTLDSTRLLAVAAVETALGERPSRIGGAGRFRPHPVRGVAALSPLSRERATEREARSGVRASPGPATAGRRQVRTRRNPPAAPGDAGSSGCFPTCAEWGSNRPRHLPHGPGNEAGDARPPYTQHRARRHGPIGASRGPPPAAHFPRRSRRDAVAG